MLKSLVALTVLAAAGSVQAAVVTLFEDDFQGETPRLSENVALANWTVSGDVDIVGMPNGFGITCSGTCVDLDGTTGPGGITSNVIAFSAGGQVKLSFDLSGSQRSQANDGFTFNLDFLSVTDIQGFGCTSGFTSCNSGNLSNVFGPSLYGEFIPGNRGWATYALQFTPVQSGSIRVGFSTTSADNIGPLLDNVLVTQAGGVIPEPATWALLIAGFGLVGVAARRRRSLAAA